MLAEQPALVQQQLQFQELVVLHKFLFYVLMLEAQTHQVN